VVGRVAHGRGQDHPEALARRDVAGHGAEEGQDLANDEPSREEPVEGRPEEPLDLLWPQRR
jgi:hypothetical protein